MKHPMFDKNDNAILYEHEFPIILKCEKCGKSENLRFIFPIIFPTQRRRLNTSSAPRKTKKASIGGSAIAAEACM